MSNREKKRLDRSLRQAVAIRYQELREVESLARTSVPRNGSITRFRRVDGERVTTATLTRETRVVPPPSAPMTFPTGRVNEDTIRMGKPVRGRKFEEVSPECEFGQHKRPRGIATDEAKGMPQFVALDPRNEAEDAACGTIGILVGKRVGGFERTTSKIFAQKKEKRAEAMARIAPIYEFKESRRVERHEVSSPRWENQELWDEERSSSR